VQIGGTTVPPSVVRRMERELGVGVSVAYGQSEAPSSVMTALDDTDEIKAETIGRPRPHREVKIVRPGTDETVRYGEVGELYLRSPLTMSRYWGDPHATAEVLGDDGWLHTGDLCTMDASGVLRVEGRSRDVVIRGGENVYPAEVEHVLAAHPTVAEVAVAGLADDRWGESVAAWVRPALDADVDPGELESWARTQLASHKVPRTWFVVEDFPRTASGKIQKFRLPGRGAGPDAPT
jgi:fatty-acyl-CoA synthase